MLVYSIQIRIQQMIIKHLVLNWYFLFNWYLPYALHSKLPNHEMDRFAVLRFDSFSEKVHCQCIQFCFFVFFFHIVKVSTKLIYFIYCHSLQTKEHQQIDIHQYSKCCVWRASYWRWRWGNCAIFSHRKGILVVLFSQVSFLFTFFLKKPGIFMTMFCLMP